MKHKILRKQSGDYGMNTLIELEDGRLFTLSSTKMMSGDTTYNIYVTENISDRTIICEDGQQGYYEAIKFIKTYTDEPEYDESYVEPELKISEENQLEIDRIERLCNNGEIDIIEAQRLLDQIEL